MSNPRLTLRQLQIFSAVAETGSTNAAARRAALSQSATSAAVLELEHALGLPLFDRVGRRLLLNADGRALLPRALALLDSASDIEAWASGGPARIGRLLIGASTTIGNYLLPGMLARFGNSLPAAARAEWTARAQIANTAAIIERVHDFQLDIGLIEGPCHEPDLTVVPWLTDELVIVAARNDPLLRRRGRSPVPLDALRQAAWLLRETGSGTRETVEQALIPHLHHLRATIELGSSEAIKRAVACGLGLSCLSRFAVQDLLESGELVALSTPLPRVTRTLFVIHHGRKPLSRGVQLFLEQLHAFAADAGHDRSAVHINSTQKSGQSPGVTKL